MSFCVPGAEEPPPDNPLLQTLFGKSPGGTLWSGKSDLVDCPYLTTTPAGFGCEFLREANAKIIVGNPDNMTLVLSYGPSGWEGRINLVMAWLDLTPFHCEMTVSANMQNVCQEGGCRENLEMTAIDPQALQNRCNIRMLYARGEILERELPGTMQLELIDPDSGGQATIDTEFLLQKKL